MEHLTELKKIIAQNSPKPLTTKDVISEVKNMNHFIQFSRLQQIPRNATGIQSNSRQKYV